MRMEEGIAIKREGFIEGWNSALQKAIERIPNSSDLEVWGNSKVLDILEGLKKK